MGLNARGLYRLGTFMIRKTVGAIWTIKQLKMEHGTIDKKRSHCCYGQVTIPLERF